MSQLLDFWQWPLSPWPTTILATLLASYLFLVYTSHQKSHPSEPPIVTAPFLLPYLGHLLLMALHGGHSTRHLGLKHAHLPIVTLVVPFSRLYLVTSPSLAAAIQRKPSAQLSFDALLPDIVQRVLGLDSATRAIVERGLDYHPHQHQHQHLHRPAAFPRGEDEQLERGFLADLHDMLVAHLGPGPAMDALTLRAVRELGKELDAYVTATTTTTTTTKTTRPCITGPGREEEVGEVVDLLAWVRHLVTPATARLLYGPRNPLVAHRHRHHHPELLDKDDDNDLEAAFWDFDHGLGRLLMGVWPRVTAARAYAGREKLVAAFREYVDARHYEDEDEDDGDEHAGAGTGTGADKIILERLRIAHAHGFSVDGIARSELSFLFAGIVNTATTTFWMLARLFADRALLAVVRSELVGVAEPGGGGGGSRWRRLSLRRLTRDCPRLRAVYKEVLRLGSNNFSTRLVKEDTMVLGGVISGGKEGVWLRKGSVVQIAGGVMHSNPTIWGDDVEAFKPWRHLSKADGKDEGEDGGIVSVHPAAFRAFGGGRTMCPGRHFATGEILGLVAHVVMRLDMEGVDQGGEIKVPELDDYILPVHILEPVAGSPVRVRMRPRRDDDRERVEVVP